MLQKENGMLGEEWKSAEFRECYPPEGGILMNMLLIRPSFQMRSKGHCVHIMKIMNAVHSYSNPSPPSQPFFEDVPQSGDALHSSQNCQIYLDKWNLNTQGTYF